MADDIPVITLDGVSGSGKGTIARRIAQSLGWHYLDSGAFYRAIAWVVMQNNLSADDQPRIESVLQRVSLLQQYDAHRDSIQMLADQQDISMAIRHEECGKMASQLATKPYIREFLIKFQRNARISPGLVADGRDMGEVVFPDARVKFFLTASLDERAQRRWLELQQKGIHDSLSQVRSELLSRDKRDQQRDISPACLMPDMIEVDTTHLSIDEVVASVIKQVEVKM